MILEREVILGTEKNPLMILEKYEVKLTKESLDKTRKELHQYIEKKAGDSFTWGYFPGITSTEEYPNCKRLQKALKRELLSQIHGEFSLAFIRLATSTPISDYGGLHVDVDISVRHTRTSPNEIVRLIVNLGDFPRTLEYVKTPLDILKKQGIKIPRDKYKILKLPNSIKTKKIKIPPKEKDAIWVLRFWSSLIPHAGITNDNGHFLAAYGRYCDKSKS